VTMSAKFLACASGQYRFLHQRNTMALGVTGHKMHVPS